MQVYSLNTVSPVLKESDAASGDRWTSKMLVRLSGTGEAGVECVGSESSGQIQDTNESESGRKHEMSESDIIESDVSKKDNPW